MLPRPIARSIALISPLGQYHWRGIAHPGRVPGFHNGEDGDATYHTAVLANSLSWAYKNIPGSLERAEIRSAVERMLQYFLDCQSVRAGCLMRNIVRRKAYDSFRPQEQHCDKEFSLRDEPCMKYIIESEWCYRYDISLDAISQVMVACYWIIRNIPDLAPMCIQIVAAQYEFYKKNDWMIRDARGKLCRYGIHKPSLFVPMGYWTKLLMEHILGKSPARGFLGAVLNRLFRTYIPGLYLSKQKRKQFNNYMAMNTLHALIHAGYDFRAALKRLIRETSEESNYFARAVASHIFGERHEIISPGYPIRDFTFDGYVFSPVPVPPSMRYGWNAWESSPYRRGIITRAGEFGQEDLIQALYLR